MLSLRFEERPDVGCQLLTPHLLYGIISRRMKSGICRPFGPILKARFAAMRLNLCFGASPMQPDVILNYTNCSSWLTLCVKDARVNVTLLRRN